MKRSDACLLICEVLESLFIGMVTFYCLTCNASTLQKVAYQLLSDDKHSFQWIAILMLHESKDRC